MPDGASATALRASPCATRTPIASPPPITGSASTVMRRHSWTFPATARQVSEARSLLAAVLETCSAADDIVLCLSELATNAMRHSASAAPGGTFTVGAEIAAGIGVWVKVYDDGGAWQEPASESADRMHGLAIVRALATSISIDGDADTGWIVGAYFALPLLGAGHGDGTT
jgi:anti-sigma regulatory factor (Ser/Thr protein kinase)